MKSAEQKIDAIFTDWVKEGQTLEQLERRVVQALKEQDRDTRHACAKAVVSLDGYMDGPPFGCSKLIVADEAHAACMNARAL